MIKRVIEISSPARLTVKNQQLVITCHDQSTKYTAPLEDIGLLVLDNPTLTYSLGLMTRCLEHNVAVITCDTKHLPSGMFLPLHGNSLQTKVMAKQLQMKLPLKKRLWQLIVKAKIQNQAAVLKQLLRDSGKLLALIPKVKTGDSTNIEAQAARIYWQNIFSPSFKRDKYGSGINSMLNYGYAVLRAAVARAVVGAGLHPSIGLHHHNQYDSFCLIDDLLEPLRPLVDLRVYKISQNIVEERLTPTLKKSIVEVLNQTLFLSNRKLPLFVALHYYASSLRKAIEGEIKNMEMPRL